jgi:multicomponent Na+:H+ antiporter subunit C
MAEYILGHYAYWFVFALMTIGLYGMIFKRNLVKKLIGMTIFQVSVIIFFISTSSKWSATVPVLDPILGSSDTSKYIDPLPHTLMLTAIVVGVATSGVAFALAISIYKRYKTLNESELIEKMKKDDDSE